MSSSKHQPTETEQRIARALSREIRRRGLSARRFTLEILGRQNEDWVQRRIRGDATISIPFLEEVAKGLEVDPSLLLDSKPTQNDVAPAVRDADLVLRQLPESDSPSESPYSRYLGLSRRDLCMQKKHRKLDSEALQEIETQTFVSPESALKKAAFSLETHADKGDIGGLVATLGLIGSIHLRLRRPDHDLAKALILRAFELNDRHRLQDVNAYLIEKAARLLFAAGQPARAQRVLSAEIGLDHPLPHNYFALRAMLLHYANEYDQALSNMRFASKLASGLDEKPPGFTLCEVDIKARIFAARGQVAEALGLFELPEEFLARVPPLLHDQLRWLEAQVSIMIGRVKEALPTLESLFRESLLAKDPQHQAHLLLDLTQVSGPIGRQEAHRCMARLSTNIPIEAGLYNELVQIYGAPTSYRMRSALI